MKIDLYCLRPLKQLNIFVCSAPHCKIPGDTYVYFRYKASLDSLTVNANEQHALENMDTAIGILFKNSR